MVPQTIRGKMPKRKLKRPNSNIKRKRKFTRQNRRLIYEALRTGLPIGKATELAGLDRSTYYRWLKKGKDDRYPVHQRFRKAILRIQVKLEKEKLDIIRKVAQGGYTVQEGRVQVSKKKGIEIEVKVKKMMPCWQAAAWFLERRYPELYGRKRKLNSEDDEIEKAAQIKEAFDAMKKSVPTKPEVPL